MLLAWLATAAMVVGFDGIPCAEIASFGLVVGIDKVLAGTAGTAGAADWLILLATTGLTLSLLDMDNAAIF